MIFKIIADTAAEFQAFKTGQVSAIYPQPQLDGDRRDQGRRPGHASPSYNAETGDVEALWINNAKFPFDSTAVRQAVGYAIDRDAIVEAALR